MRIILKILPIFIFLVFLGCKEKKENQNNIGSKKELINKEQLFYLDCKESLINGIKFKACIKRPGVFTIKNNREEIIYTQENPTEFNFQDFNQDGYLDIVLEYLTNTPGTNDVLLFNKKNNSFEKVIDFMKFPSAIKIQNSDFYFSYHKSGCADNDWDSDLFKIVNNKAIRIGNIRDIGCKNNYENGIYINKVIEGNLKLLNFIKRDEGYWNDKWDFIEKYWYENYEKFK